jgi:REP element-mobilizing transposase RayT
MPRKPRIKQEIYPYHVTTRALKRDPFPMDLEKLWLFACDLLLFCTYAFEIEIHSFVLMNNHYHMIVRTPRNNLDKFMNYFNKELGREIFFKSGEINQKFGTRYHCSIISNLKYYHSAYKYVYRNPVTAKVCTAVEDYPFSSINFLTCRQPYLFPIFDTYFQNIDDHWPTLKWLNEDYEKEIHDQLKKALKKTYFELNF